MRYVIGVDGSSNGTTAVLVDSTGNLLGAGVSGASVERELGDSERFRRSLSDAIGAAINMADLENARIAAACVSMPGIADEMALLLAPCIPADLISVGIYAQVQLNTISLGSPGVVVMADDTVEAYGVNCFHESITVGGWKRPGGDDGSSIAIAHRAISACSREIDGVGAPTLILPMLLRHMEVLDLRHFLDRCTDGRLTASDVAAVNEIVNSAAAQGDAAARTLLRDAGKDLGSLAASLLNRLQMQGTMPAVGTVGSVFRSGRLVLKSFRETVHKAAPHCKIVGQQAPVCVGAAISALEEIGVEMQETMVNTMRASLPRLSAVRVP